MVVHVHVGALDALKRFSAVFADPGMHVDAARVNWMREDPVPLPIRTQPKAAVEIPLAFVLNHWCQALGRLLGESTILTFVKGPIITMRRRSQTESEFGLQQARDAIQSPLALTDAHQLLGSEA